MFDRIRKRPKPRVYLGTLTVLPRSDFKRHFEGGGFVSGQPLEAPLRLRLEEIFNLPLARECEHPGATDLAVDLVVVGFQTGTNLALWELGVPLLWRPKIELAARVYRLGDGETTYLTQVVTKQPWREYRARLLTVRSILGLRPLFDAEDMAALLSKACLQMLPRLIRAV
ncbi:MAG: hypothetical protein ABWY06_22020 [Pseudomonas sp.]|uniref:hypothetical protein n=1 Tax=Pseudomonas sp. TaxID=306 RepID=UPI003397FC5F